LKDLVDLKIVDWRFFSRG